MNPVGTSSCRTPSLGFGIWKEKPQLTQAWSKRSAGSGSYACLLDLIGRGDDKNVMDWAQTVVTAIVTAAAAGVVFMFSMFSFGRRVGALEQGVKDLNDEQERTTKELHNLGGTLVSISNDISSLKGQLKGITGKDL